jgi:hypothetical protein
VSSESVHFGESGLDARRKSDSKRLDKLLDRRELLLKLIPEIMTTTDLGTW